MRRLMLAVVGLVVGTGLWALGQTEDPSELQTKTWTWDKVTTLEIAGEVEFTLVQGPQPKVTVTTSRALFDQLSVYNWWGWAGVVVESGLKGPRERGTVKVTLELPSLEGLSVRDHSVGTVAWPGSATAEVHALEHSVVTVTVTGVPVKAEVSWFSQLTILGTSDEVRVTARHQSTFDARGLRTPLVQASLDEKSIYQAGSTGQGAALLRHGSQVTTPEPAAWTLTTNPLDEAP